MASLLLKGLRTRVGSQRLAMVKPKNRYETERTKSDGDARQSGGRFFRQMLLPVRPEHVPELIYALYLLGNGGKKIEVPDGRWFMPMPLGYRLRGEGPVGVEIEPPPINTDRTPDHAARPQLVKIDEQDTSSIVELCAYARTIDRPGRDRIIEQLYLLDWGQCAPEAVQAVDELTYDLISGAE